MSAMLLMTLSAVLGQYGSFDRVDGFTKDGQWLVGANHDRGAWESESWSVWYESTVTGARTTFEADADGNSAAFDAWSDKHPLGEKPIAGRTSPDGLITIDIVVERAGSTEDGWSADSTWRVLAKWKDHSRFLMNFSDASRCEIFWAPNSRTVLVETHVAGTISAMRGTTLPSEYDAIRMLRLDIPVINVAGPNPTATAQAIKQLPPGWRSVPSIAMKKREATVVYFAPGQETRARSLLAKLPGATLKAMDWEAPYDVVVALGGL